MSEFITRVPVPVAGIITDMIVMQYIPEFEAFIHPEAIWTTRVDFLTWLARKLGASRAVRLKYGSDQSRAWLKLAGLGNRPSDDVMVIWEDVTLFTQCVVEHQYSIIRGSLVYYHTLQGDPYIDCI